MGKHSEQSRREAYTRLRDSSEKNTQQAVVAYTYWKAWDEGVVLEGERVHALTDHEMTYLVNFPKPSVIRSRNNLMGKGDNYPEYHDCPLIAEHGRRKSLKNTSDVEVTAFGWRPELFREDLDHAIFDVEGLDDPVEEHTPESIRYALPGHDCEKVATYSNMLSGDTSVWVGRVTDGIQEPYCLHIQAPGKPQFAFGLREDDVRLLSTMSAALLGEVVNSHSAREIVRMVQEDSTPVTLAVRGFDV